MTAKILFIVTLIFQALGLTTLNAQLSPDPLQVKSRVVHTKYGRIQGFGARVGRDAQQQRYVEVFLGIPYASPPVGNSRFSPTRPPVHWTGVRSAMSHSPVCPQVFPEVANETEALQKMPKRRLDYLNKVIPQLRSQSEDCLFLNIYVPNDPSNYHSSVKGQEKGRKKGPVHLYPVMVYIHGEGFSWGSGNLHDGRSLATYGKVIVVTINYRLGVLGFLNTNINPGRKPRMANYGLMDQIAALKWIQENIQYFGGNPKSVTLFGHNRGAACIHYLMQSPVVVPDLFHKAIMMSGSAFSDWAMVEDPVHYAVKLASALNCSIPRNMAREHDEIVSCLRRKSLDELTKFTFDTPSFLTAMGPSRDGVLIPADFGLDVTIRKSRAHSTSYQVVLGMVEDESTDLFFGEKAVSEGIGPQTRDQYLRTLIRNTYNYHMNEIFATVQNEYTDWSLQGPLEAEPPIRPRHLQMAASRAITDKLYLAPLLRTANWCNQSAFQTFFYIYSYCSLKDSSQDIELCRSYSGSMLPLIFGIPFAPELKNPYSPIEGQQATLARKVLTFWANFATSGNPNRPYDVRQLFGGAGSQLDRPKHWDSYEMESQKFLQIDSSPGMKHHPRLHAMSVWLHLIPKLHNAGANNIFPAHNAFTGHDDPSLFAGVVRPSSFSHGYQVNREYLGGTTPAPPLTTCFPLTQGRDYDGGGHLQEHPESMVRLEKASAQAYQQAMYLTVGIGALLLGINVWFLLCLIFCRSKIACCIDANVGSRMGNKENSADTDIMGLSTDSLHNIREHQIGSGGVSVRSQQGTAAQTSVQQSTTHSQPMRSLTTETLRAYHQTSSDNNSDRDSRSTSSQSQCGHRRGSADSSNKKQQRISYISSNDTHMTIPLPIDYHHQVVGHQKVSSTLPRKPLPNNHLQQQHYATTARPQHSGPPQSTLPSALDHVEIVRSKQLQHTGGSNCRLHINNGSNNTSSTGSHSVTSSSSTKSGSIDSSGTNYSQSTKFNGGSNSGHGTENNPEITSTIKRNPKAKLTTFCSPEAQIMQSPLRKSPAADIDRLDLGEKTNSILMHNSSQGSQ